MDHRLKIKESKKIEKYFDLARGQKLWNMRVTVILVVVSALGTIPNGLEIRLMEESGPSRPQHC